MDHLEELRWRLVRCSIAIVIMGFAIWFAKEWILDNLFLKMKDPSFPTFAALHYFFGVKMEPATVAFQSTQMAAQFSYAMNISILGGFVLSSPYIFFQFWQFIKPGLKANELNASKGIVVYICILFFIGILFGYFIVAPMCVQFFSAFQISTQIKNVFTIDSFLSMILSSIFYSGLLFLLPVVIYLLTKIGIVTPDFLRKYRKHSIVGVLVLSAVITPPDALAQILVAIPILGLYELGIVVSQKVYNRQKEQELK
jgi:sec-independent protein translocase protein TatC